MKINVEIKYNLKDEVVFKYNGAKLVGIIKDISIKIIEGKLKVKYHIVIGTKVKHMWYEYLWEKDIIGKLKELV